MGAGSREPGAADRACRSRRALRIAACAALAAAGAAIPTATGSASRAQQAVAVPTGLQTFQLRPGDGVGAQAFSRTPSLAWQPVRGVARYELELATTRSFAPRSSVVWTARTSIVPAAAIPVGLPWLATGPGPSLWWRVRALGSPRVSGWSAPAGFRLRADAAPKRLASPAGSIRWSSVPGATGYQVSFANAGRTVFTPTTVADLREYHADGAPAKAMWRVRAERRTYDSDSRALPASSYGPWSDTFTTPVRPLPSGGLTTLSERVAGKEPRPHHVAAPVFLFPGAAARELHHVYVASDPACRNVVLNSAVVRGGAFAPRSGQFTAGGRTPVAVNSNPVRGPAGKRIVPSEAGAALVDLPAGQYFWTVVPVERLENGSFRDLETPPAACRSARGTFTIDVSAPAVATAKAPYATGLLPRGRLGSAAASGGRFYGEPLVAWRPSAGATRYQVQWSRSERPWRPAGSLGTAATAATLPLPPGTWWYRVRGLDDAIRGDGASAWSDPARVEIVTPTLSVVPG